MSRHLVIPAIVFFATVLVATAVAAPRPPSGPVFDWPQLLRDPKHTSYDPDKHLTVSNAPSLGLNWMSALRSADLGSPVIDYNVALQKTVAYIGDERGDVTAFDESNGTTLWSTSVGIGDSMRSSPLVDPDGAVWVATAFGSTLYKLDGSNGAVLCSVKEPLRFNASPMVADPPGGVPTLFIATNDAGTMSGPTIAVRVTDCATLWSFDKYKQSAAPGLPPPIASTHAATVASSSERPTPIRPTAAAAVKTLRAGALPAATVVDTAPMPKELDDAAVQREIAHEIVANHWKIDVDAQIFVLASHAPQSGARYCDYRSAFHFNADATTTAVYAVIPQERPQGCPPLPTIVARLQSELLTDPLLNAPQ